MTRMTYKSDYQIWIGIKEDAMTKRFGWSDKSFMNLQLWNPNGVTSDYKERCVVFDRTQGVVLTLFGQGFFIFRDWKGR